MDFSKIPAELKKVPQWVLWRNVERDGKQAKVPFAAGGGEAKSNDPKTWKSFQTASKLVTGETGLGFMFSESDPFCGIDLDGCRDSNTGKVSDWARDIIKRVDSYTEVSPSGTGVKIWVKAKSPFAGGKRIAIESGDDFGKRPEIEVYDKLRYFAVTGQRVANISPNVEERDISWLKEFIKIEPKPDFNRIDWQNPHDVIDRARKYLFKIPPAVSGQRGHDQTFKAVCRVHLGFGLTQNETYSILSEWNQSCQPPWSEADLWHKIKDADRQMGPRNYLRNANETEWEPISTRHEYEPPKKHIVEVKTLESAVGQVLESLKAKEEQFVETGFPELDYALGGGLDRGEMVVMAARPSHGKSAVALQMIHNATANGMPSMFISEEMSMIAIGKRAIAYASDVPREHWRTSIEKLEVAMEQHFESRATCYIAESCRTVDVAAEQIRKHVAENGVEFVVVDYAQLLSSKGNNRYEQVTNTSLALRRIANETGVVLIVLCQLSRKVEERQSFNPILSDLRESGQIEQDADVITFLVWPWKLDPKRNPHDYQILIAKNRNRPINHPTADLKFEPSRQRFSEVIVQDLPNYSRSIDAWNNK